MSAVKTLPWVLYQTHRSRDLVPTHIDDAVRRFAADFKYEFYDDERILSFLAAEFGDTHVKTYGRLKLGAHKADFWRYCVLYKKGGVYLDIKTKLTRPLCEVFACTEGMWYCTLGAWCGTEKGYFHQGVIASPPGNPVLRRAIEAVITTPNEQLDTDYFCFVRQLYDLTAEALAHPPSLGENAPGPGSGGLGFTLFEEVCGFHASPASSNGIALRNAAGGLLRSDAPNIPMHVRHIVYGASRDGRSREVLMYARDETFPWNQGEPSASTGPGLARCILIALLQLLFVCAIRLNKQFFLAFRLRCLPMLLVIVPAKGLHDLISR